MKSPLQSEVARAPRGLHGALGPLKSRLALMLAVVRAWRWGAVFGRILLVGLGLVLLGAIGRSARARSMLSSEPPSPVDAGAASATAVTAPVALAVAMPPTAPPTQSVAPAPAPVPVATPAGPLGRATPDDPVYLNQATLTDLHRLPGVGPKRAEAIITLRSRLGHFRQIEDLLKVKGIGRSSLRKLRPLVRLDPPPAKATDAAVTDASTTPPP
jgi:competence protein ComEA